MDFNRLFCDIKDTYKREKIYRQTFTEEGESTNRIDFIFTLNNSSEVKLVFLIGSNKFEVCSVLGLMSI